MPELSKRILNTDPAIIDIVLSKYADLPGEVHNLAQGVSHWDPPSAAMDSIFNKRHSADTRTPSSAPQLSSIVYDKSTHRYGAVAGMTELREAIADQLHRERGLDMSNQEVMITAGSNQAFANVALALLDPGDVVILPRPYYFSHLCSIQLAGGDAVFCDFDEGTFLPDMDHLRSLLTVQHHAGKQSQSNDGKVIEDGGDERRGGKVKMVVITTPGNPSGAVVPQAMMEEIVELCKRQDAWLVVDEAYEHFIYNHNDDDDGDDDSGDTENNGARKGIVQHYSPCGQALNYSGIIHLYTMSKAYGMAGWRIGYAVYPKETSEHMRKANDTIPTHASIASQKLAYACISMPGSSAWVQERVRSLKPCRRIMWDVIKDLEGTVQGGGAFYYLLPVPEGLMELEAVDILATGCGVLLTPGSAFGMDGYLRLSYGGKQEEECRKAAAKLKEGIALLQAKSLEKGR